MPDALGLDVDSPTVTAAVLPSGGSVITDLAPVDTVVDGDDASLVAAVRAVTSARADETVVVLAYPASWDAARIAAVRVALDDDGLQRVRLASSAVAAATDRSTRASWPKGAAVAVVELRRDGTDVALLRRMPDGSFVPVADAARVTGVDQQAMDDAIIALVAAGIDGGLPKRGIDDRTDAALTRLHAAARIARQRLADDESTFVSVRLPGRATVVEVQRDDFEAAVVDRVNAGLPAMVAAFGAADISGLTEVFVVGAGAPAALVAELLAGELGRDVVADETVLAVVHGAARMAAETIAVTEPIALPVLPALPVVAAPKPAVAPDADAEPAAEPEELPEPEAETPDDADDVEPALVPAAAPVLAGGHVNAAQADPAADRRRRTGVLRYWPVVAAAAGLVLLGGAAAAVTLTPVPIAVNPFVGANGSGSNDVGGSSTPSSVFAGSSSSPEETDTGTTPKKRSTSQAPAVPGSSTGSSTDPSPSDSTSSSDPSPSDSTSSSDPSPSDSSSDPSPSDSSSDPSPSDSDSSDPLGDIIDDITGS